MQLGSKELVLHILAQHGCYEEVKELMWPLANSSDTPDRERAWTTMMQAACASQKPKHILGMLRVRLGGGGGGHQTFIFIYGSVNRNKVVWKRERRAPSLSWHVQAQYCT